MVTSLSSTLDELRHLISTTSLSLEEKKEKSSTLASSVWIKESEVARALYTCLIHKLHLPPFHPHFDLNEKGALFMLKEALYPWGALPYPCDHAEAGFALAEAGLPIAKKMAAYQRAISDHQGEPIFALLNQEKEKNCRRHRELQRAFFQKVDFENTSAPTSHFYDPELHLAIYRAEDFTAYTIGTGCKSGLGGFFGKDLGIINFGPAFLPLGECDRFGIASKPINPHYEESPSGYAIDFISKVSAPCNQPSLFYDKESSLESALWVNCKSVFDQNCLTFDLTFEGDFKKEEVTFVLFGKGESALVGRCHKLRPRTLDRYKGPPQMITFQGEGCFFLFTPLFATAEMEVIPLAGNENFWEADFLIAFHLETPHCRFSIDFKKI